MVRLDQESSEARAQLSDMRESYRKLSLEHKELQEGKDSLRNRVVE